ncbi:MAG: His/Gly/Thr/Pro-type tRNA ligase C-terminal domain-containing protein, partial [Phycisphaerae bacterium]
SFERFLGILIEQHAGAMPLWLSPEQARVLSISEKTTDYAVQVKTKLAQAQLRVDEDLSGEKIGAKIAKAHGDKVPYMLVVGPKEAEETSVNVRIRGENQNKTVPVDEFIQIAKKKIADKETALSF